MLLKKKKYQIKKIYLTGLVAKKHVVVCLGVGLQKNGSS